MMYTNGKKAKYPGQYVNPVDFYNYLDYLNFGGLVKADDGTSVERDFNFQPYNTKFSGYDLELDGEDFDPFAEGDFTTSKIERDRRKNERLFDKTSDYLYDESLGTQANWMDTDIDEKNNPLKNKKFTLHNTSDEEMFYDPRNPTKLYSEKDWNKKKDEDLVARSIDMLNTRHLKNPELFQKVTDYDPETGDITYDGDKLAGDLADEKNKGSDYLVFGKKEGEDNETFAGSLTADFKGDVTGPVFDPADVIAEEEQKYSFNPAQIGFEIDKPIPTPGSQMDVQQPMNTLSKFQEGNAVDYQSMYENRGDRYEDMNFEDYKTEAIRQQGLYDQYGRWDVREADEYAKHKQLQDLLGVSSEEVWDERYKPEGERMYDTLSGFEKRYVRNNLDVTEDELMSYYTHPDFSSMPPPKAVAPGSGGTPDSEIVSNPNNEMVAPVNDEEMTDEEIEEWWSGLSFDEQQELSFPGQSSFGTRYAPGEGENSWGWLGDTLYNMVAAPLSHGLDVLSMPVNLLAEGIEGLTGTGDGKFNASGIVPAFRGDFSFDTMHGEGKQISNLLGMEDSHWLPKLGVDILTDPVTYATFGLAGLGKGAASSGARAFSKEGAKAFARNAARQYGPTAGKIAVGSGLAGIASPYVFGSDPSKIDELYGDEVYAEDAGMSNWNPYPYGENIDQMQQPIMLAAYGGGLPYFQQAGEYYDEEGNYIPQTQREFLTPKNQEFPMIDEDDAGIPDTVDSDVSDTKETKEVIEVDEKKEKKERDGSGWDVFDGIVKGLGFINQIHEGKEADFSTNQLAHNQFQTDSRNNRGITDVNTGYQFQDNRVRARQGRYGSELLRYIDGGDRTTQLRNRQYDDIDTTIELDEDTIQELMALGAEIEYL